MTDQITSETEPTDLATALIELRHARQEVARLRPFVDMVDQAQRDAEAVELASPAPLLALAAREKTIRDHTLTLHLMGEQLSDIESWFWTHLADVREAARKKIGGSLPDDVTASAPINGEQSPRTTVNNPPTSSGTPADTLRERIADAARTVHLRLGSIAIGMARGGDPIILSPSEANQVADAVLAAARNDLQQIQAASETAAEPQPAAHDAGPSVREAAADDRRWFDGERGGE